MSQLNIASISDIHLGHRRTKAKETIEGLEHIFFNEASKDLDFIFIAGDVFDKMLQYADDSVLLIDRWIHEFLVFCSKFDIGVRIVEGTPYHDRRQSRHFVNFNKLLKKPVNLEYVDELSILPLDEVKYPDTLVLYVPDECDPNTSITQRKVKEMMSSRGIDKVQFAIMHGMFPHQLPNLPNLNFHDFDYYNNLVEHYIVIGDIHTPSFKGKVLAQGSPTRLTAGEEEDKGHVRMKVDLGNPNNNSYEFIVNPYAKRYDTIKVNGYSEKGLKKKLEGLVEELRDDSYITLESGQDLKHYELYEYFKGQYPNLNWNYRRKVKKDTKVKVEEKPKVEVVSINKLNVKELIAHRIKGKLEAEVEATALSLLDHYKEF